MVTISPRPTVGAAESAGPTRGAFRAAGAPASTVACPEGSYWGGRRRAVEAAASRRAMPSMSRAVALGKCATMSSNAAYMSSQIISDSIMFRQTSSDASLHTCHEAHVRVHKELPGAVIPVALRCVTLRQNLPRALAPHVLAVRSMKRAWPMGRGIQCVHV